MTIAKTSLGDIEGRIADGLHVFRGIPYAETTEGAWRFRPARRKTPWTGVLKALEPRAVAPVARTHMSAKVPTELTEIGEPEDVAALVVYLLSDRAKDQGITGQVYTLAGPKLAVWAQPRELRAAYAEGAWTPERIAEFLPGTVGVDPMPLLRPPNAS